MEIYVLRTLILVLLAAISPALLRADTLSEANAGEWQGVGVQIDGVEWSIAVAIGASSSAVTYDLGECAGTWNHLRATETQFVAIERLAVGLDTCLDGGLLKVERLDDNSLLYSYFDKAGDVIAKAVLIEGEYRQNRYKALRALTLERIGKGFIQGEGATIRFDDDKI